MIPRAIEAAIGGAPFEIFGDDYPTPDGTCLRDYIHVDRPGRRARPRARVGSKRGGASAAYNLGTGRPLSVREVIDAVERVTGRAGAVTLGAAAAGRSGGALSRRPRGRDGAGLGAAAAPDLETIVGDAWRWHRDASARFYRADGAARR